MQQNWSDKMEANRAHYISRCMERLAPMEMHINQFASSPWDTDNLKQLADHFHQIAGSAGVYHMTELTPIAEAGERLCLHMYDNPPDDVIVYWRNFQKMASNLRSVLEKAQNESGVAPSGGPQYTPSVPTTPLPTTPVPTTPPMIGLSSRASMPPSP